MTRALLLAALAAYVALGAAHLSDTDAMRACQENYTATTCHHTLIR